MKQIAFTLAAALLAMSFTACSGFTVNINLNGAQASVPAVSESTAPPATEPAPAPEAGPVPEDTLPSGDSNDETSATGAAFDGLTDVWPKLVGYWITGSEVYAVLDMADAHSAVFHYGWWETEFDSAEQYVRELTASGAEEMTATLADGEVIVIDYSGLERDGKIRIKIGDQEWRQFANGGDTADEAYQTYCSNRDGT